MAASASGPERCFFPKSERLTNKRAFAHIFKHGSSVRVGVLSCFYATDIPPDWTDGAIKVAFSVPKRKHKRAVQRNLLKRRLREAYRQHRDLLTSELNQRQQTMVMIVVYQADTALPFSRISTAMEKAFRKLARRLSSESSAPQAP